MDNVAPTIEYIRVLKKADNLKLCKELQTKSYAKINIIADGKASSNRISKTYFKFDIFLYDQKCSLSNEYYHP